MGVGKYLENSKQQLVLIFSWLVACFSSSPHWEERRKAVQPCGQLRVQVISSNSIVKRRKDYGGEVSVYLETEIRGSENDLICN